MESPRKQPVYEVIPVTEATKVRFYTSVDPGSFVPLHWHDALEIVYLQEGDLTFYIDEKRIDVMPRQCILVNPNVVHATQCTSPNRAIVFQIPVSFVELCLPHVRQLTCTLKDPDPNPERQAIIDNMKRMMEEMQEINDTRPTGGIFRFNSLLFEVMFLLQRHFSVQVFQADLNRRNKDLARLIPVLQYTEKNYNRPISIDEIAEVAALQPRYFCRLFKKCMGVTFLEYQNEIRLSYIYRDLITTEETVTQILERHGFTNYKLFRRMFAEHFNATPVEVRKTFQKNARLSPGKRGD